MATRNFIQAQEFQLAGSGCSSSATSITLKSFNDAYGIAIDPADLNDINYGTIEPGTDREEIISFVTFTTNADGTVTLTTVTRGLLAAPPYTADSSLRKSHAGSTVFVLSNNPQLYRDMYDYLDSIVASGGSDASDSVKGTTKLSVAAVSPSNPISVGDNDPRVPTQNENNALVGDNTDIAVGTGNKFVTQTGLQHGAEIYAADAGANDTYVITLSPVPTSYTAGMTIHFKANTINTGAATINVNSLGAKTIVKGVNTTLADADIAAGMINTIIYDGTNFVLQNPNARMLNPVALGVPGSSSSQLELTTSTPVQVTTDGFIFGSCTFGGVSNGVTFKIDDTATPTTIVGAVVSGTGTQTSMFCFPIKKNYYYRIVTGANSTIDYLRFISLS